MIEKIRDRLLDIIAADARIYRSGNAYGTAFLGVKREEIGDTPTKNWVNLFDCAYEPSNNDERPAIYCGMPGMEVLDELDFETNSGGRTFFRIATIPLVVVAHDPSRKIARQMCRQLRSNLLYILLDYHLDANHWWKMDIAEGKDAVTRQLNASSGTGGGADGQVEGKAVVPVTLHYSISKGGADA